MTLKECLEKFKPDTLAERNVEATYRRTVDIPGEIVLIGGSIKGNYWFYGEQPGKEKTK